MAEARVREERQTVTEFLFLSLAHSYSSQARPGSPSHRIYDEDSCTHSWKKPCPSRALVILKCTLVRNAHLGKRQWLREARQMLAISVVGRWRQVDARSHWLAGLAYLKNSRPVRDPAYENEGG